ncbi:MAG: TspO/MBR family protein [Coprobacillaceae bacterium]
MKRSHSLIISILLPFLVAGITYFSVQNNQDLYASLLLPNSLIANSYVYVFLWAIQYVILGYASYLIYQSQDPDVHKVLVLYAIQLFFLFLWPIFLFNMQDFLLTVIVLLLSWGLCIIMIYTFYKINRIAGYLLVPYFIWIGYMLHYHFSIFMLN